MSTPPSDDTKTLFKLVADGEWHSYWEIKEAIAATVPPGRALRKYDEVYQAGREQRGQGRGESPHSEDEQIKYGALKCAQRTISSWKRKALMSQGEGDQKQIRLKPGFKFMGSEPSSGSPDPPSKPQGYTEVPPDDSEPSEDAPTGVNEAMEVPPVSDLSIGTASVEIRPSRTELPEVEPQQLGVAAEPAATAEGAYAWPPMSPSVTNQECLECGLGVLNLRVHRQWHEEQDVVISSLAALVTAYEDQLRSVSQVEESFSRVLDQFQHGMQRYLEEQFSQVDAAIHALRRAQPVSRKWVTREARDG